MISKNVILLLQKCESKGQNGQYCNMGQTQSTSDWTNGNQKMMKTTMIKDLYGEIQRLKAVKIVEMSYNALRIY